MSSCLLEPWFESGRACASVRVIILSDVANEADDSFAIAHALLTPSFDVRAIVAQHFGSVGSVERSVAVASALLKAMPGVHVPLVSGARRALDSGGTTVGHAALGLDGARAIVKEALRDDARPLYVLGMGPLTDMAIALELEPAISDRLTVVWVGGGRYPRGGHEANLARDLRAARLVFESGVALWQIPSGAYKTLEVPISQLVLRLAYAGELGLALLGRMRAFAAENMDEKSWIQPESWVLGDQAAVGVLLAEQKACWHEAAVPRLEDGCLYGTPLCPVHTMRVYDALDTHLILEDMFAKFELFARLGN